MNVVRILEKKKKSITFSHNFIEVIAMIAMLVDHAALTLIINGKLYGYDTALFSNAITLPEAKKWIFLCKILRMFGRIAFPIFAFLIVEGFRKTSNIFKYMIRIFICALVSEIPYNLMVFNRVFCVDVQNVLVTYLVGLLMLLVVRIVSNISIFITPIIAVIAVLICRALRSDYWLEGIILIYMFYIFRNDLNIKCIIAIVVLFLSSLQKYYGAAALSVIFIYFYDGTKGYINLKRIPYIFFPLHMLILYGILFFSFIYK